MSHMDIIRAWKDEEFRQSLSPENQALLPENPAHRIELNDIDLDQMQGGAALTPLTWPPLCSPTTGINCLFTLQC